MSQEIDRHHARRGILQTMSAALIGVSIVAVIQFLTLPNLDRALTASLYCFIVSIPLLTYYIVTMLLDSVLEKAEYHKLQNLVAFFIGNTSRNKRDGYDLVALLIQGWNSFHRPLFGPRFR